ncbi:MAG TPA: glycosyltransferase family 2 protein, partial [Beutenbergiaceae bacterium]|nr:glycosyltransferase family 2 protein [Beutenbergiaceae bacterium]
EAARNRLIAELDSALGLDRVTENAAGVIWRVRGGEGATDDTIARARLLDGDGQLLRTTPSMGTAVRTGIDAEGTDRTLVLAERADAAWRAELGGRSLRATEIDGQQAFMIPDDAHGLLTVDYQPSVHLPWRLATVIILVLTALLALPTRRRRGEEG